MGKVNFKKEIRSQVHWHVSVAPATRVAEVGGPLEPGGSRPAWATKQDQVFIYQKKKKEIRGLGHNVLFGSATPPLL